MKDIHLRPTSPEKDFSGIAALISSQEEAPTSEVDLHKDYETHQDSLIRIISATDDQDALIGFHWAWREKVDPSKASFHLVVKPECRGRGVGRLLYQDMEGTVMEAGMVLLRTNIPDTCPEGRAFAEARGFTEARHTIAMRLDMASFDDQPYDALLERLRAEGFRFTSMAELGDTEEARRNLYALNDAAVVATMGQSGEHTWTSFEDFNKSVCSSDWYCPAGQIIAIDTATGAWAAMSAITRFAGQKHAYNLFTGVDLPYRGRKLGQAAKVLALRYAREVLQVQTVRTHHNTRNEPMLAIDRKFGYEQLPGTYQMEKRLG